MSAALDLVEQLVKTFVENDNPQGLLAPGLDHFAKLLYKPDPRLKEKVAALLAYRDIEKPAPAQRRAAGILMEQVAYLAFRGLMGGALAIDNFRSASGPQYDLLVRGDSLLWVLICGNYLGLSAGQTILVECKATDDKVTDQDFARLCALLDMNLRETGGMGIFFTLSGATGFPEPGQDRYRKMSECLARQCIFHAQTKRPVVVLDHFDLADLARDGDFAKLLRIKIREIVENPGLHRPSVENHSICELPTHLAELATPA